MMAGMITGDPDPTQVKKYYAALRRAQCDIDLRPELYTHYYKREFPERFRDQMDVRYLGPGERIVSEKYSELIFEEPRDWLSERDIFPDGDLGANSYAAATFH